MTSIVCNFDSCSCRSLPCGSCLCQHALWHLLEYHRGDQDGFTSLLCSQLVPKKFSKLLLNSCLRHDHSVMLLVKKWKYEISNNLASLKCDSLMKCSFLRRKRECSNRSMSLTADQCGVMVNGVSVAIHVSILVHVQIWFQMQLQTLQASNYSSDSYPK